MAFHKRVAVRLEQYISNIAIFFYFTLITFILRKVTNKRKAQTYRSYVDDLYKLIEKLRDKSEISYDRDTV